MNRLLDDKLCTYSWCGGAGEVATIFFYDNLAGDRYPSACPFAHTFDGTQRIKTPDLHI